VILDGRGRRVGPGKLFLLPAMASVELDDEHFIDPPHGYRRGDSAMQTIHCQL
jgi:hypothetical protein